MSAPLTGTKKTASITSYFSAAARSACRRACTWRGARRDACAAGCAPAPRRRAPRAPARRRRRPRCRPHRRRCAPRAACRSTTTPSFLDSPWRNKLLLIQLYSTDSKSFPTNHSKLQEIGIKYMKFQIFHKSQQYLGRSEIRDLRTRICCRNLNKSLHSTLLLINIVMLWFNEVGISFF